MFISGESLTLAAANPSREQILERIRAGLRVPAPEPREAPPVHAEFFEPVQAPLERFLQECKANLMECHLTADAAASSSMPAQVLESLPEGGARAG